MGHQLPSLDGHFQITVGAKLFVTTTCLDTHPVELHGIDPSKYLALLANFGQPVQRDEFDQRNQ